MTEELYKILIVTLELVSIGLIVATVLILIKGIIDECEDIAWVLAVIFIIMFFTVQYQIVTLSQMPKIPNKVTKEVK